MKRPALDLEIAEPHSQAAVATEPFQVWREGSDGPTLVEFHRVPDGYRLRYPGIADMILSSDGRRCVAHPCAAETKRLARHFFRSQVRPMMLELAGWQVYHGSSVESGGGGVAFLGESGLGKSTLAASFSQSGHDYLSDDFICLSRRADGVYVQEPVEPSLRLRPESAAALVETGSGTLVRAKPLLGKTRYYPSRDLPFCSEPRPLRAAFFLADEGASEVRITPFAGAQTHVEWVRSSFLLDVADAAALTRQMSRIARLVAEIPCFRLDYPRDFSRLGEVRAAVLDRLSTISPPAGMAETG